MLSGGPGKSAMTSEAAVMEMQSEAGLAFDPNIVDVFVKVIRNSK
jgi:response regulator RpfG family c-di-GMP phosphodiesterase